MFREQRVALQAVRLFNDLVQEIDDSKWSMEMPPEFFNFGDAKWTLRETINYHAYDDAWIPDMLAGKTMAEVGEDKWKGDLLGDDPKGSFARINQAACAAIENHRDPESTVHYSFGDYKASDALLQVISFRGFRVWDISRCLGMNSDLPADLVDDMWDLLTPHAEEWRQFGVYGPPLPVPEGATPQQRLLATLGFQ